MGVVLLPAFHGQCFLVDQRALGVRLVLVVRVVDHFQDLDGTERGAEAAKRRELVGVDLWHAALDAGCADRVPWPASPRRAAASPGWALGGITYPGIPLPP
jgi:hypothetical protein